MARTNNLTNFLTDVATAIKAKLGTETPIPASQFDTKIGEIETGGTYQAKSITIQSNGSQTITPDSEYDALSSVVINVQVPVKQLQSKSYEFTDNTHIVLSPETGYDGFSSIELTINVPSSGDTSDATATAEDLIEGTTAYVKGEKIEGTLEVTDGISIDNSNNTDTHLTLMNVGNIPSMVIDADINDLYGTKKAVEDGTGLEIIAPQSQIANAINLTAEKIVSGNTILDIEGTGGGGDVKLFETVEEMQADPEASEGDLAVVYRNELEGITGDSEFSSCICPNEVVLSEAFTGSISGGFGGTDQSVTFAATVEVSSSRFIFSDYVESEIIAQYTSQDGITYTRTDGGEELVEFGTTIKWESFFGPFNSIIGNFMKIGGMVFEGLYEYKTNQYVIAPTQLTLLADKLLPGITGYGKNGITVGNFGTNVSTAFNDDVAKIYTKAQIVYNNVTPLVASDNNKRAGLSSDIVLVPCKSDGTPLLDTSNVTNMYNMFAWCSNLTLIPLLDTSNVTNMSQMFYECTSLKMIPVLNTSNVTNMMGMFIRCTSLMYIPLLDTSNVTSMTSIFADCTSLTTIPQLDTSSVTTMYNCFLRLYIFNLYSVIRYR